MFRIICTVGIFCCASVKSEYVSFDKIYEDGVAAYMANDWEAAIHHIEDSLKKYKEYNEILSSCSTKCSDDLYKDDSIKNNMQRIASKAICVKMCLTVKMGDMKVASRAVKGILSDFKKLVPHQYLQFAYYQKNMLPASVSAAYTYHLKNPDDKIMNQNMEFFKEHEDVTTDMFVDRELEKHILKYGSALEAHAREDYVQAESDFEEALQEYHRAVNYCYGSGENIDASDEEQWEVTFYRQDAHHYVEVMESSLQCIRELSAGLGNQQLADFLPVIYERLQHAHFHLRNFAKCAQYIRSYLLYFPNNTDMEQNLKTVSEQLNNNADIQPNNRETHFFRKINVIAKMVQYAWNYFGMKNKDQSLIHYFQRNLDGGNAHSDKAELEEIYEQEYENMKAKTDDILSKRAAESEYTLKRGENSASEGSERPDVDISHVMNTETSVGTRVVDSRYVIRISDKPAEIPHAEGPLLYEGIFLLANSSILRGSNRFAVDGLSNKFQCQELIDLAVGHGRAGDGYHGKESPHTKHETFVGVTVLDAALAAKAGNLPVSVAKLYYDLSEMVRAQVQAYFHLPYLFFDFTHLVCRTAKESLSITRDDLSHPVHADNCLLSKNMSCVKEPPAFVWRDYSAILYLNNDFDGGEFIFTDSTARRANVYLKPKCGRMVSFSAGKENLHGVKPVLRGRRCAIALWFTLTAHRKEVRREQAKDIIDHLLLSSHAQKIEL